MHTLCSKTSVRWWVGLVGFVVAAWSLPAQPAMVRHAPQLEGTVEGSLQLLSGEKLVLNGAATIMGDLLVPGTPTVRVSPRAHLGATAAGTGSATPSRYTVTLNPGVSVGRLVTRTDPVALPEVARLPRLRDRRDGPGERAGRDGHDFSWTRERWPKERPREVALPPDDYGELRVPGRHTLVLGVAGAGTPAEYSMQRLELKPGAELRLAGPVTLTLGEGLELEEAVVGESAHPEWLELRIASGGLEARERSRVFAHVVAPRGEVSLGNRAELTGGLAASRLTVHRRGVLRLRARPAGGPPAEPAVLPYLADFEPAQGYEAGPLHGQSGWEVAGGTATIAILPAADGAQAVELGAAAEARRRFAVVEGPPAVAFVDFFAQPMAGDMPGAGSGFSFGGAEVRLQREGTGARVVVPAPEGMVPAWIALGELLPLDAAGRVPRWVRITARLDFPSATWDLWVDGTLSGVELALSAGTETPPALSAFSAAGPAAGSGRFDALYAGAENPLFADADHDGMDDAWELANGLDPTADDRHGDRDGDGLGNLREYRLGLRADRRDSDGDGMADDWELAHGLDPKFANSLQTDADGDGVTDIEEFLIGTDPAKADTDGDGLPDHWEAVHEFDARSAAGADDDPDGDGLTNRQEFAAGSDPRDFFNGVEPVTTSPAGAEPVTGDILELKVTRPDGSPWANAPVEFQVADGGRRISATAGGPAYDFHVEVRTDANGVARAYLEPLAP